MLPVLLLVIGGLITGYALWQVRRWLRETSVSLTEGPRRLEAIAEELINSAEAASAAVAEETERLADLITRAEARAGELRALLERSPEPVRAPGSGKQVPGARGERVMVTAVPVRFRHARKEIRRTAAERTALSQPGPGPAPAVSLSIQPAPMPAAASVTAEQPVSIRESNPVTNEMPETHRLVYTLADRGQDVTQIARQLSMTKGEVQLILSLRRLN